MEYIGLDIGTHTIRYIKENNILFDQVALLAFDTNKKTMAIGTEASQLRGTRYVRNYRRLSELYSYLDEIFNRYDSFRLFHKTTVFFTAPSTFDKKQCEKIRHHILEQGATQVIYDKELWCAAIGAKLQISTSISACMLYMGHASCDIACFSNGIIQKKAIRHMGVPKFYKLSINGSKKNTIFKSVNLLLKIYCSNLVKVVKPS